MVKPMISHEHDKNKDSKMHPALEKNHLFTIERIENLSNLLVQGKSKFQEEYKFAEKNCHKGVDFILDHVIDNDGVGEPEEYEEMIDINYDHKLNFC